MGKPRDILLDDNNDLLVGSGDFGVGDASAQSQRLLLLLNKGELKQSPLTGVGITSYIDDEDAAGLMRSIRTEFVKDGIRVKKIDFTNGKITTDAEYSN